MPLAAIPASPQLSPSLISLQPVDKFPRRDLIQFFGLFQSFLLALLSLIWPLE